MQSRVSDLERIAMRFLRLTAVALNSGSAYSHTLCGKRWRDRGPRLVGPTSNLWTRDRSRRPSMTGRTTARSPSEKLGAVEEVLPPVLRRGRVKTPDALIASLLDRGLCWVPYRQIAGQTGVPAV